MGGDDEPAIPGLSDALPSPEAAGTAEATEPPPHYLGHRQRLRQRLLDHGTAAFADYELLEMLLALAIPRRDVKPLAKDLLARFGDFASVIAAAPEALMGVPGIKETTVAALKLVEGAAIRCSRDG
jgi:DNA repair protein RadC